MAVVSIATIGGVPTRDGAWNADQTRRYKEIKRVRTDNPLDSQLVVLQAVAASIPLFGAYPGDATAQLKGISVRDTEWPMCWEAEVEWDTETLDQGQQVDDPRNKPALISYSTEMITEAVEKDFAGGYICNSAGESFETPAERERVRTIITIEKNLNLVDDVDITTNYLKRTNSVAWKGYAIGKVFLRDWSAREAHEQGIFYYATTWTFVVDTEGWKLSLLDAGPNYRDLNDPTLLRPFLGPDGVTRQQNGLLNGVDGEPLPFGVDAKFLEFTMYGTADFNLLPIN